MYKQGKCYKCGGFLAVNDAEDASVCPFCNNPFVVAEAIQCFLKSNGQGNGTERAHDSDESEFVVERSVLIRYNGYTKKDIRIPEGITEIRESAFQGMNNIESVHLPESVELIGEGAFAGCKNLRSIAIPEGVEAVDRDAFNGCISLKSIRFPRSIKKIEASVLTGCTGLEAVILPKKIEMLPWRLFEGCTSLKSIVIPKSVITIEDYAFAECTALETVKFECVETAGKPSEGLKRIGMNAFRNCENLKSVEIPGTLEYIGNQAFRGCSKLKTLRVPDSVIAIYPLAFADCINLEQVVFEGSTKLYKGSNPYKHGENAATFYNCPKLLNVVYSELQRHFWAFPAHMKAQEKINMENGRCRYCGGEFKGIFEIVCSLCKSPKDY